jgi:hypothetical protein
MNKKPLAPIKAKEFLSQIWRYLSTHANKITRFLRRKTMFDLDSFNELSIINGSGHITAKIKEVLCVARDLNFTCDTNKFINIIVNKDMVTAKVFLSFSIPTPADDAVIEPSFTIDEIIYIKNTATLVDLIEELLCFIIEKGYFVEISPSDLRIVNHTLTIKLLLKFTFQLPSLAPLTNTLLSTLQKPYKPDEHTTTRL